MPIILFYKIKLGALFNCLALTDWILLVKEDELLLVLLLEVKVVLVVDNELVLTWVEEVWLLTWVRLELSIYCFAMH